MQTTQLSHDERRQLEDLKAGIRKQKDRIRRLQIITRGKDSDFWKALREECSLSIESMDAMVQTRLDSDSKDVAVDYAALKLHHGAARAYRGIIANVEKADQKIDKLNDEIAALNRAIDGIEKGRTTAKAERGNIV